MRVTARGVGLFLGGIALVVIGLFFGYSELTIIGCAGLVAFAAALVVAVRPWSLEVQRVVTPPRVARGDSCRGVVTVRNTAKWRGADLLATDRCALPGGVADIPVPILRLKANEEQTVHYALPTQRRGVIDVGPLTVSRRDLFNLVRSAREFGGERSVWVHPTVRPLRAIPAGAARSLDGRVDKVEHGSIMFHALREYVPGDDLRHVHWRTSARIGSLMVREHVDTSLPRMALLLDDRASAYPTDTAFEEAVEVAASVAVAALRENLALDLHTSSGVLLSSTDAALTHDSSVRAFLDALTEVKLHETEPGDGEAAIRSRAVLRAAGQRLRQRRRGDTLVTLTGSAGAEDLDAVTSLRDVFPSIVCGVFKDGLESDAGAGMSSEYGALIIGATTAEEFAGVWDGVRAW